MPHAKTHNTRLVLVNSRDYPGSTPYGPAELDAVLGADGRRVPGFADRPRLPYLQHVLWEVLRWNPIGPLGKVTYT